MKLEDLLKVLDEDQIEELRENLIDLRNKSVTSESYDSLTTWIMRISEDLE